MSLRSLVHLSMAVLLLTAVAAVQVAAQSVTSSCPSSVPAVVGDLGFLFSSVGDGIGGPSAQSTCNGEAIWCPKPKGPCPVES